jgi:hypothetical protein
VKIELAAVVTVTVTFTIVVLAISGARRLHQDGAAQLGGTPRQYVGLPPALRSGLTELRVLPRVCGLVVHGHNRTVHD